MAPSFADLSHHQASFDLAAYVAAGHRWVVFKATGGATDGSLRYVDPLFAQRWKQAADAGLHRVAYHFARNNNSGADEFAWCMERIDAAGGLSAGDILCYDQEDARGQTLITPLLATTTDRCPQCESAHAGKRLLRPPLKAIASRPVGAIGPFWAAARQRTHEWAAAALNAGITSGWIYSGAWYLNPAGILATDLPAGWRQLWISDYTAGQADTAIEIPTGWTRDHFVARQFTDQASVAGISGGCDYNRWLQAEPENTEETDLVAISDDIMAALADLKTRMVAVANEVKTVHTVTLSNADIVQRQILAAVKPLVDDEAATSAGLDEMELHILTAVANIMIRPDVVKSDPDAVATALRDYLVRETSPTTAGESA